MAGIKIVNLPALGRNLASTDLFELSLAGGTGSRKITGQEIMNASKLSVGNTPIVNGAVGQLLFQGTGNVLGESANLFWDNTNVALTLGSTATRIFTFRPQDTTGTYGNSSLIRGGNGNGRLDFFSASNITELKDNIIILTSVGGPSVQLGSTDISFNVASSTRLKVAKTTGNVLVNTTTDSGYTFDVNGTARVSGLIDSTNTFTSIGAFSTGIGLSKTTINSSTSFSEVISVQGLARSLNNFAYRVYGVKGIGATDGGFGTQSIEILTGLQGAISVGNGNKTVTTAMSLFASAESIGTGNTITNYYGAYLQTPSGTTITNKWGLFQQDTTSKNYFGGNVLINTTTDNGYLLDVNGTARVVGNTLLDAGIIATSTATTRLQSSLNYFTHNRLSSSGAFGFQLSFVGTSKSFWRYDGGTGETEIGGTGDNGSLKFYTNNTEKMRVFGSTGNIGINTTTDAGFKLDVNGTARVNNDLTIGLNRYLKAFRWTQDDVTKSLQLESNSNYNVDSVNVISLNNNLLNNTKNFINIGLASTVTTQSSGSTDACNVLNIIPTYNMPFGTHTIKGIYYNPTLTSMVGTTHYAFHSTSGRVRLEGLPTSPAGLSAGDLYNDLGTLKIV